MAFRIHDCVERGEIDNRIKDVVQGRIWLHGRAEPLLLELKGNAWPDLAGCFLAFTNPKATPSRSAEGLNKLQNGSIGDLTASRKVRVWDVPCEEACHMLRCGQSPPEHMANCLYLEWFSEANGRVVIESTDYQVTISDPQWRPSPEQEAERASQAAAAMSGFIGKISEAFDRSQQKAEPDDKPWDEFDYETFLKQSDAQSEKYAELLDKYGDSEDAQKRIDEEMGWTEELTEEEAEQQKQWIEEMNAASREALLEPEPEPDPAREGIDWIRTSSGYAHPLQRRSFEAASRFHKAVYLPGSESATDPDLLDFVFGLQMTSAKLAGALGSIARGVALPEPAFTVAYLKRALGHLHTSQTSLETAAKRKAMADDLISEARKELFEIREEILNLMQRYRNQA